MYLPYYFSRLLYIYTGRHLLMAYKNVWQDGRKSIFLPTAYLKQKKKTETEVDLKCSICCGWDRMKIPFKCSDSCFNLSPSCRPSFPFQLLFLLFFFTSPSRTYICYSPSCHFVSRSFLPIFPRPKTHAPRHQRIPFSRQHRRLSTS